MNQCPKRPRDMNQLAKHVIDIATGQVTDEEPPPSGRAIGGHARASGMSAEERSALARKGAAARWGDRA